MSSDKRKKVLLINPSRGFRAWGFFPHSGLGYLSAILKKEGHEVLSLDYNGKSGLPQIEEVVDNFKPDVVGISTYTASWTIASDMIDKLLKYDVPILVGGPHVACYPDELSKDERIDYIIKGEAENIIGGVVASAKKLNEPKFLEADLPDVKLLPYPDFTTFYDYEEITSYPLLTSRGCPFQCSYCAVHLVSSSQWRPRDINKTTNELKEAEKNLPELSRIVINDDNFSLNINRAKKFLRTYIEAGFNKYMLEVSNVRADKIDDEFLALLKEAGCISIAIGVEHADPEVFEHVKKGETLEDIKNAAKMIKKQGIRLGLCFIIGLPFDSLEKTKKSIEFTKDVNADFVFWNMLSLFKGTRAMEWFQENGKVYGITDQGFQAPEDSVMCDNPLIETPDFSIEERKKAYLMATLKTNGVKIGVKSFLETVPYVLKYGLYSEFLCGLVISIKETYRLVIEYYKHYGVKFTIKKIMKRIHA